MQQKVLDQYTIRRINQLFHDQGMKQVEVSKRLSISRTTVRRHLMKPEAWAESKAKTQSSLASGSAVASTSTSSSSDSM